MSDETAGPEGSWGAERAAATEIAALPGAGAGEGLGLGPAAGGTDWPGLKQDTLYFMGYQFAIIGVLYAMPESVSGWSAQQKEELKWRRNIRYVVWDTDSWWINYGLHPYWGATYYVRARGRGFSPAGAFWYAATLSTIFEFGAEAFFEEPSAQDLVMTPVVGSFLGQYFMGVRENIKRSSAASGHLTRGQRLILTLTDPLGALNGKVNSVFGSGESIRVAPLVGRLRSPVGSRGPEAGTVTLSDSVVGLQLSIQW